MDDDSSASNGLTPEEIEDLLAPPWRDFENYLAPFAKDGSDFSVYECADEMGLEVAEASHEIQRYQRAQRGPDSKTMYVLRRVPGTRTRSARWAAGIRTRDANMIGVTFHSDASCRVNRAVVPDWQAVVRLNPRASRRVERMTTSMVDHALAMVELAIQGANDNDN